MLTLLWAPVILLSLKKKTYAFGMLHFPPERLHLIWCKHLQLCISEYRTAHLSPFSPQLPLLFLLFFSEKHPFCLLPLRCSTFEPHKALSSISKNQWQYFLRRSVEIKTFSMVCLGSGGNQLFIAQASSHTPPAAPSLSNSSSWIMNRNVSWTNYHIQVHEIIYDVWEPYEPN